MRAAVLLLALAPAAGGCLLFGSPLAACVQSLLPEGHAVEVRIVWDATGAPVEGACAHAHLADPPAGEPVQTRARAGPDGVAMLRLPSGAWSIAARAEVPGDAYCAYTSGYAEEQRGEPHRPVPIEGPRALELQLDPGFKVCT